MFPPKNLQQIKHFSCKVFIVVPVFYPLSFADFDEMHMTTHEWSEKVYRAFAVERLKRSLYDHCFTLIHFLSCSCPIFQDNTQWQEQFAAWSLNSQNQ